MSTGKQVLVVEDDAALSQSLTEQLRLHEEFECVVANSGQNALEVAKENYYDIILLDVGLPDIDGRDVCKLMRRAGSNPRSSC